MLRELRSARLSPCCLLARRLTPRRRTRPIFAATGRKLDLSELRAQPETNQVVVKFREGEKVRLTDQKLTGMRSGQANLLNNVLRQAGVTETAMTPLFEAPPEELERDRNDGQRRTGRQLADLSLYFVINAAADGERRRGRQQSERAALRRICAARAQARPAADLPHPQGRRSPARGRRGAREPRRTSRRGKPTRARRLPASAPSPTSRAATARACPSPMSNMTGP